MRIAVFLCLFPFFVFTQYDGNTTPTYPELIRIYQSLAQTHDEIQLFNMGKSDTEFPLYLCVINGGKDSLATFEKARSQTTILINNAIHPGEPDGVNASLLWIEQWIRDGKKWKELPVIAIIPAYNVGGMLNRSSTSRANQDGPVEYGFRGNAQNLDLNRDFIKMDSENARTFARIFHALNPDVFVDNHVSDGADYQYTLTLISSLKERLTPSVRSLTYDTFLPQMTIALKKKGWDWAPYVETKEDVPESGIVAFNDLPRYAMGYASLFHTLSFTVETHMLKPFPQRVQANLAYLEYLIDWSGKHAVEIETARQAAIGYSLQQTHLRFDFETTETCDWITFKGYEFGRKPSAVTGLERLYYDRSKPVEKMIPYYNHHLATDSVRIPKAYVVCQTETKIIDYLRLNGVRMEEMNSEQQMVNQLKIETFDASGKPYEGHYLHSTVSNSEEPDSLCFPKGSVWIPTDQTKRNFIVSVLEPRMEDSYFAWNFMDSYVQEKEYFSAYVFEEKAAELLAKDPMLANEFYAKKRTDQLFAQDAWAQLFYIYRHSPYFESKTFNRLPVYKIY